MTIVPTLLLLTSIAGQLEESFQQDFGTELHPMIELIGGQSSKLTRRASDGLLMTLPNGKAVGEEVAVGTKLRLHGNFEITLDYKIVSVRKPDKGLGAGVKIWCQIGPGDDEPERITLGHLRSSEHDNAFAVIRARPTNDGETQFELKWFDATTKAGKLRLTRTGTKLQYEIAEGGSELFRTLHEIEVTERDVFALRFVASRHGSTTPLSVKFHHVDIQANTLLARGETKIAKRGTAGVVFYAVLLTLAGGAAGGAWVFRKPLYKVLFNSNAKGPAA